MPAKTRQIGAVVLAAGQSRRMGRCKSMLPLDGKPVLAHVLDALRETGSIDPIIVVTGHEPEALSPVLHGYAVETAHNVDFEAGGMISSVKVGLSALRGRADAAFIVLGDQPLIQAATLSRMLSQVEHQVWQVALPAIDGKRGHPVLLAEGAIAQVLSLPPGSTLRDFIHGLDERMFVIEVNDPAILVDLDTPVDYHRVVGQAMEKVQLD